MTDFQLEISFEDDGEEQNSCSGSAQFGKFRETFNSSLQNFSKALYVAQWAKAIQMATLERQPSALFYNVDLNIDGTGWLWFFTLIPSEELEIKNSQEKGIFVTQSFRPVCTNPDGFLKRRFIEFEDGTFGDELSYYFLDLKCPERFFGYLDTNICGRSYWFVENEVSRLLQ